MLQHERIYIRYMLEETCPEYSCKRKTDYLTGSVATQTYSGYHNSITPCLAAGRGMRCQAENMQHSECSVALSVEFHSQDGDSRVTPLTPLKSQSMSREQGLMLWQFCQSK